MIDSVPMVAIDRPEVVGRYAIYGKIASGGMASVHFGRLLGAAGFSRTVAIKRLHPHLAEDPDFFSTMLDEARLAARIHHPNVVPTLDVVSTGSELLVVMEYVRGESLARLLRAAGASGRRVPLAIISAVVVGALQGLHAAHEATSDQGAPLGIVHRDVSPQNILVGVDGQSRVIDFGVAKAAGRLQTTSKGLVKGKISYMAPEQLASGHLTRQSDLYAMAVVLWEALANKRLFQGEDQTTLLGRVLAGARDPPSRYTTDLPDGVDALVMKGLAREPADRFVSAREMAEALMRVLPPAFPLDVAAWVEDVARDALAQRGAQLAGIESDSGSPVKGAPVPGHEDVATTVQHVSSISVDGANPDTRPRSGWFAGASIVGLGLLAIAGVLWARGRAVPLSATPASTPSIGSEAASATPPEAASYPQPSVTPPPDPTPSTSAPAAALVGPPPSSTPSASYRPPPPPPHASPQRRPAHTVDPLAP
jgi:serine/threonine protein kinase